MKSLFNGLVFSGFLLFPVYSHSFETGFALEYPYDTHFQKVNFSGLSLPTLPHGTKYWVWNLVHAPFDPDFGAGSQKGKCFEIWTEKLITNADTRLWFISGYKNGAPQYVSLNDDAWGYYSRARVWTQPGGGAWGSIKIFVSGYSTANNNDDFILKYKWWNYDKATCNDGGPFVSAIGTEITYSNTN